jgi:primosomal replication protein N
MRLSGNADMINILVRGSMLDDLAIDECAGICVRGQLRSFNNRSGQGSRLIITVFARQIYFTDEPQSNYVALKGTICKSPTLRRTPMGRQICDLMLAVNRRYGRSDYLPCIAWGTMAQSAAQLEVGEFIHLEGRIQSRKYIKNENGRSVEKTAFEVSAVTIEK